MEEKDDEKNPKEHDVENDTEQRSTTEEPESEHHVTCYLEDEVASAQSICNLDLPSAPTDRWTNKF